MAQQPGNWRKRLVVYLSIVAVVVGAFLVYQFKEMRKRNIEAGESLLRQAKMMEKLQTK